MDSPVPLFWDFRTHFFATWERLGVLVWRLGSTLGRDFGISGAPWEAILASRDHPGGPWEQQDGHEVANNRILVDFGLISGPVYVGFWSSKCVFLLFLVLFTGRFLIDV